MQNKTQKADWVRITGLVCLVALTVSIVALWGISKGTLLDLASRDTIEVLFNHLFFFWIALTLVAKACISLGLKNRFSGPAIICFVLMFFTIFGVPSQEVVFPPIYTLFALVLIFGGLISDLFGLYVELDRK